MPAVGFEPKISAGEWPAAAHLLRSWVTVLQFVKHRVIIFLQYKITGMAASPIRKARNEKFCARACMCVCVCVCVCVLCMYIHSQPIHVLCEKY